MKLYSSKSAPNPRKVLIYLAEKNITDVEIINLDLGKLEHKKPAYKAIAPNSRVPALQLDNDEVILETTAICRYLECLYPLPNMFGENPSEIALIEMWYSRVTFELVIPLGHGFRHTHPAMSEMENQNKDFGLAQREVGKESLKYYEKHLEDKNYITCNKLTYADLQMVTSLQFIVRLNKLALEDFQNLDRYVKKISSRPSFSI